MYDYEFDGLVDIDAVLEQAERSNSPDVNKWINSKTYWDSYLGEYVPIFYKDDYFTDFGGSYND